MPTLVEYQPTEVELGQADVDVLIDMVKATSGADEGARLLESLTPTRRRDVYVLRSGPFVGRLGLPSGAYLDFKSRFDFLDIYQLILLSMRDPIRRDARQTPVGAGHGLVDWIAEALATELERIVGAGLAKGYVERRFERPPFPGAIDVNRHLSRYGARPDRLVTRARRMTVDIFINRALLAALEVLRQVPLSTESVVRRLARIWPAFGGVSREHVWASAVNGAHLTKLTSRYRPALSLAEIVLRVNELVPTGSTHQAMGMVFSMPRVWERYVHLVVSAEHGPQERVEHGHRFNLSAGGLPAEADVAVLRDGTVTAVLDAKYKPIEKAPTRDDIYQMVTYCERLGLNEATLVHPGRPSHRSVTVGTRKVHVRGLPGP